MDFETEKLTFFDYIKSNIWIIVLFLLSFVFISFAINKFFEGLVLIGIFLISIFISYIYQKDYKLITKILIIVSFSIFLNIIRIIIEKINNSYFEFYNIIIFFILSLVTIMFFYSINYFYDKDYKTIILILQIINMSILTYLLIYFKNIIIIFLLIFALFFAIFYYVNHKKEFRFIIITSIISIILSFTLSFLIYLILTYTLFEWITEIDIIFYCVVLSIISFIFMISFFHIQNILFKKIGFGVIDEIKIFKSSIIFSVIILIFFLIVSLMISNHITNNLTNYIDNKKSIIITNDEIIFENENLNNEEFIIELNNEIKLINKKINEFKPATYSKWDKLFNVNKIYDNIIKENLYLTKLIVQKELIHKTLNTIEAEYNWIENNLNNNQSFYHGHSNINEHILKIKDNTYTLNNKYEIITNKFKTKEKISVINYLKRENKKNNKKNIFFSEDLSKNMFEQLLSIYFNDNNLFNDFNYIFSTNHYDYLDRLFYKTIIKTNSKINLFNNHLLEGIINMVNHLIKSEIEDNILIKNYNEINNEQNEITKLLKLKTLEYELSKKIIHNLPYDSVEYLNRDSFEIINITKNPYSCLYIYDNNIAYVHKKEYYYSIEECLNKALDEDDCLYKYNRNECLIKYSFYDKRTCDYIIRNIDEYKARYYSKERDYKKDCLKS